MQTKHQLLRNKLENLSAEKIKDILIEIKNDFRDGADIVFEECLKILEEKITSDEFCRFCEINL
jgi:hypothetical protein